MIQLKNLIRFDKQLPPKGITILVVWWHRNGIHTSQKTCAFVEENGNLILDLKITKKPTFWCYLFK